MRKTVLFHLFMILLLPINLWAGTTFKTCIYGGGYAFGSFCNSLMEHGMPNIYSVPMNPATGGPGGMSTTGSGGTCYASNLTGVGPYTFCGVSSGFLDGNTAEGAIWIGARTTLSNLNRLPGIYSLERGVRIGASLNEAIRNIETRIQQLEKLNQDRDAAVSKYHTEVIRPAMEVGDSQFARLETKISKEIMPALNRISKMEEVTLTSLTFKLDFEKSLFQEAFEKFDRLIESSLENPEVASGQLKTLWQGVNRTQAGSISIKDRQELQKIYEKHFDPRTGLLKVRSGNVLPEVSRISSGLQTALNSMNGKLVRQGINDHLIEYEYNRSASQEEKAANLQLGLGYLEKADLAFANGDQELGRWYLEFANDDLQSIRVPLNTPEGFKALRAKLLAQKEAIQFLSQEANRNIAKPEISVLLHESARDFLKEELQDSAMLIEQARTNLDQNEAPDFVKFVGNYARAKAMAVFTYTENLGRGVYAGVQSRYQAAAAVFSNPQMVGQIARDIVNAIKTPREFIRAAREAFIFQAAILIYGDEYQRGQALGGLLVDLSLTAFGGAAKAPLQGAMQQLSNKLVEASAATAVGERIVLGAKVSTSLTAEVAKVNSSARRIADSARRYGIKIDNRPTGTKVDKVIFETLQGKGNLTSKFKLSADEALQAGEKWVGSGYKEIGKPGSGVFRSADGQRQFRMDRGSLAGTHDPNVPHVHLEEVTENGRDFISNNHVPFHD